MVYKTREIKKGVLKLKKLVFFFIVSILSLGSVQAAEKNMLAKTVAESDSINLMAEASLFFEAYKNKQFDDWTIEKGFNIINTKPDAFLQYHLYRKLDKVIWAVHDDSTTSEEHKQELADTVLYLYNLAVKYDTANIGNYLVRKAYVLETWKNAPVDSVIAAYEKAFATGQKITAKSYYMDRLGQLYAENASDENDYQMKALNIYLKLSEEEPDNQRWIQMISSLAEDEDQLLDALKKSWESNKDNTEKAWAYAIQSIKFQAWERAIEPLEYLVEKHPDVINYWKELARAYDKAGMTDKAISAYKKLIKLQPDNRDNYLNLALIYKNIGQLAVARSYLHKASRVSPDWDYPYYVEGTLYEQAARECGFDFEDKLVYLLAIEMYRKAKNMGGQWASQAADRIDALKNSIPTKEDYFFRHYKNGDKIKIKGKCYDWINKSVTVRF